MKYAKRFEVKWSDCDPNGHVRGSAYIDYSGHVSFSFLRDRGFPIARLIELGVGPVITKDETDYIKEVKVGDEITIHFKQLGMSSDGSRWRLLFEIFGADGKLAARHVKTGGWFDLRRRRFSEPAAELAAALREAERAEEFVED